MIYQASTNLREIVHVHEDERDGQVPNLPSRLTDDVMAPTGLWLRQPRCGHSVLMRPLSIVVKPPSIEIGSSGFDGLAERITHLRAELPAEDGAVEALDEAVRHGRADPGGEHRAKLRHHNLIVSARLSMPHSCGGPSTFRRESGKRIYVLTARRMISGLQWEPLKGLGLLVGGRHEPVATGSRSILQAERPGWQARRKVLAFRGSGAIPRERRWELHA